jgi:hypothetical protein
MNPRVPQRRSDISLHLKVQESDIHDNPASHGSGKSNVTISVHVETHQRQLALECCSSRDFLAPAFFFKTS